jgi:hypothetical protein
MRNEVNIVQVISDKFIKRSTSLGLRSGEAV